MFGWLKQNFGVGYREHALRPTLFGDVPLDSWGSNGTGEPWESFARANGCLQTGDQAGARAALSAILLQRELESRQYLQAWHALRELGDTPPQDHAKHVYGVVVDVPVPKGLDTVVAYEDRSARYLNFSGAAVVWEHPDASLISQVEALLAAGRSLVQKIGPWEGSRPPLPPGHARISILTPSGIHFGQASFELLSGDPFAAPVIGAAAGLMQALIAKADSARATTA